jgi:arsenate reductase
MEHTDAKKRVLFICAHNTARSQMAEGFLRALYGDRYEAYSAGTEPTHVHPCAIKVMQEAGIDISTYRSKGLEKFDGQHFDYIVTLCADDQEACPIFIGGRGHRVTWHIDRAYLHQAFDDPAQVKEALTEADCSPFRAVRDQLKEWIEATFGTAE